MTNTLGDKRLFYIFLAAVLIAHMSFMLSRLQLVNLEKAITRNPSIQIKLINEEMISARKKQLKQIVQSEDSENTTTPEEAYLSDKNRSFDRQTVAKNTNVFQKASKGNAQITQKNQVTKTTSKKKDFKNLKLSDVGIGALPLEASDVMRAPASESIQGMKNGDNLEKGISATNDYVEEVQLGDFTHLNTVEYKYYGFFHRIRQKLEQFWGRSIQEKANTLFKSGRRLPASDNLITSLQITLNSSGEIIRVKILGTSGVKELDDAAIESFNQAGPFPNPPKELLVNGQAVIEWGFVVKS
jgi:TonB family protein